MYKFKIDQVVWLIKDNRVTKAIVTQIDIKLTKNRLVTAISHPINVKITYKLDEGGDYDYDESRLFCDKKSLIQSL